MENTAQEKKDVTITNLIARMFRSILDDIEAFEKEHVDLLTDPQHPAGEWFMEVVRSELGVATSLVPLKNVVCDGSRELPNVTLKSKLEQLKKRMDSWRHVPDRGWGIEKNSEESARIVMLRSNFITASAAQTPVESSDILHFTLQQFAPADFTHVNDGADKLSTMALDVLRYIAISSVGMPDQVVLVNAVAAGNEEAAKHILGIVNSGAAGDPNYLYIKFYEMSHVTEEDEYIVIHLTHIKRK